MGSAETRSRRRRARLRLRSPQLNSDGTDGVSIDFPMWCPERFRFGTTFRGTSPDRETSPGSRNRPGGTYQSGLSRRSGRAGSRMESREQTAQSRHRPWPSHTRARASSSSGSETATPRGPGWSESSCPFSAASTGETPDWAPRRSCSPPAAVVFPSGPLPAAWWRSVIFAIALGAADWELGCWCRVNASSRSVLFS